jgi:hypothetical protein
MRGTSRRGYGSGYGRAGVDVGQTGRSMVASILFRGGWGDGGKLTITDGWVLLIGHRHQEGEHQKGD